MDDRFIRIMDMYDNLHFIRMSDIDCVRFEKYERCAKLFLKGTREPIQCEHAEHPREFFYEVLQPLGLLPKAPEPKDEVTT